MDPPRHRNVELSKLVGGSLRRPVSVCFYRLGKRSEQAEQAKDIRTEPALEMLSLISFTTWNNEAKPAMDVASLKVFVEENS